MSVLADLLGSDAPDMQRIESHLDQLGPADRITEVRTLGRAHQARLFEGARGRRPISLDHIVPQQTGVMEEVVHHGKNSLPAFNHFAKVFVRPDEPTEHELWGYNRTGPFIETVVGPGYFVAVPHEAREEVLVDYLRIPPRRPAHWPEILPNSARLSRFVYHGTQDVLRGVSRHVTVGRAMKGSEPMAAWFVLCRQE